MTPRPDALVVGAGFAGVAAATALAERGARVSVIETRQRPGGRAYSYTDPATGETRDNGQHVLGSFYGETARLLARLGTADALEADPALRIRFWERGRGAYEFSCPSLPAPFHWLAAAGSCARLSAAARVSALTLHTRARSLIETGPGTADPTVEEWLGVGPGHADLATLLGPVALAALNERPSEGSARLFARVLDRLLAAPAERSGLALPRRGVGELLRGFESFVETRGGTVRYRATALGIRIEGGRTAGVSLLGGERLDAPAVVLAVPHERLGWMVRPEWLGALAPVAKVPWSPIVSTVHVLDRPALPARFVSLIGTATQWAFDRGATTAGGDPGGHAIGTIRSAAFEDVGREIGAIASETEADLREAFPAARHARVLSVRVYKERRATMRATPDVQRFRPPPTTEIPGLYLAGDWTDTGLPPTIEGAVQSGHAAAALLR